MSADAERDAVWARALAQRSAAIARAHAAEEATIVAAHRDGMAVTAIAAALGVRNRARVYAVLAAAGHDGQASA